MRRGWQVVVGAWMGVSLATLVPARVQAENAIEELRAAARGPLQVKSSSVTGLATFVAFGRGGGVAAPGATPEDRALGFLRRHGRVFGAPADAQLGVVRTHERDSLGIDHVRVQQLHRGVPVTGAELMVHIRGSRVVAANGKTLPEAAAMEVTPSLGAAQALERAREVVGGPLQLADVAFSEPRLEILDVKLLGGPPKPRALTWFVEARRHDLREYVWVHAQRGAIVLRFSQLPDARSRWIYDANDRAALPGTLVRREGQGPTGDSDADLAYEYSGDTFDYFFTQHGRDSYNGKGAQLKSSVHYCPSASYCPYSNAYWNGTQMVYGEGFSRADDVVAHELTHAVTDTSASLYYYMQSGALNESFSDIFGETVDLLNGKGNDLPAEKWKIGEELPVVGAIRHMMNPNLFQDPGKMSDPQFVCESTPWYGDSGGVHANSGVPNHAYALMADGGTYNGLTVSGIGLVKAGKIQHRTLTRYLLSASDFLDAYNALLQSCQDLVGSDGITAADCGEVQKALDAVELGETWPCPPSQPAAPSLCPAGQGPVDLFYDDLENTTSGNWKTGVLRRGNHWIGGVGSSGLYFDLFATSGRFSFWGISANVIADSWVGMSRSVPIPPGARLQFSHAYGFYHWFSTFYDGGVLEYSTDNGRTWSDAGSLISAGAPYNGTLWANGYNPLRGRNAFVSESWGYTATQLDLTTLAGTSARFRFRIGTGGSYIDYGWFIDDVRLYTCDVGGSVELSATAYTTSETGPAVSLTATRTGGSAGGVTVDYTTGDGTALGGQDFTPVSGTLRFASNQTSQTVTVPILNDTLDENDDESFDLFLSNAGGPTVTLGPNDAATVSIADNDVAGSVQLSLTSQTVAEAAGKVTLTVRRSGGAASGVTVDYATLPGSAAADADYTTTAGTLTFDAGVVSRTFFVPIRSDALDEPAETFSVVLSQPGGGASLGPKQEGTVTITDDDTGGALQFSLAAYSVSEGAPSVTITVTRSGGAAEGVAVDYTTNDGTAAAGVDYGTSSGTLLFGAGVPSQSFVVPILQDGLGENNETVRLSLSNPAGGATLGPRSSATLTILEDEAVLQFAAAQFNVKEPTPTATITVKRSGDTTQPATVHYQTSDGSATQDSDYGAVSGTLSFGARVLVKTFTVPIRNDAAGEPTESVVLSLDLPTGGVLGPQASALLLIADDDPVLSFSAAEYVATEGGPAAVITVKRTGSAAKAVSVDYATADGTAQAGADYTPVSGTLGFSAGQISKSFSLTVLDDFEFEGGESVALTLGNPTGGAGLGIASAVLTITDNEPRE